MLHEAHRGESDIHSVVDPASPSRGLDDCLRGGLQAIELPPLREGDKVAVTYIFTNEE